jgi:hypothetical protein
MAGCVGGQGNIPIDGTDRPDLQYAASAAGESGVMHGQESCCDKIGGVRNEARA